MKRPAPPKQSHPPAPSRFCPQGNTLPGVLKFHGLITTFEMIMADCPELKKLHWRCVVIDEAHRLKNRNCKLLEGLKLMNLVSVCVFEVLVKLANSFTYLFFFKLISNAGAF